MATVKLILRTERTNKSGEAPLYIRMIKDRKPQYISLNFRLPPSSWNQDEQKIKSSYPNSTRLNAWLKKQISDVLGTYVELHTKDVNVRTKDIKATILGTASPKFLEYGYNFIERKFQSKGKTRTYKRFRSALNKLKDHLDGKHFTLEDMTTSFLKNYEYFLLKKHGNKENTIHTDLKSFRRILNEAVDDDLLPFEKNPFNRYKLKWEKTTKVYLTEMELKAFEECEVNPKHKIAIHKDVFVFACYTGGLRISDICRLKWIHFNGTHIIIDTYKTNSTVSIKLPDKSLELIEKYKIEGQKPSDHIFPLLDSDKDYENSDKLSDAINGKNAYANKNLLKLAKLAGIEKKISFHTSRHTWATRALSKGMKIHHVSKLLGHASVRTTEVYAKIINKDLDDAMDVFNN